MKTNIQNISKIRGPNKKTKAFTLVEILIVVIILGILASIIIPRYGNTMEQTRESMLRENMRMLRTQINSYRAQHWDTSPGYPAGGGAPTEGDFLAQMTLFTDDQGNTNAIASPVFKHGPYLREIPENPFNNSRSILILADGAAMPAAAPNTHGWIYKPETNELRPDAPGADGAGKDYYDY